MCSALHLSGPASLVRGSDLDLDPDHRHSAPWTRPRTRRPARICLRNSFSPTAAIFDKLGLRTKQLKIVPSRRPSRVRRRRQDAHAPLGAPPDQSPPAQGDSGSPVSRSRWVPKLLRLKPPISPPTTRLSTRQANMGGALIVWAFLILAGVAALSFVAVPKGTNQVSVQPPVPSGALLRRGTDQAADAECSVIRTSIILAITCCWLM